MRTKTRNFRQNETPKWPNLSVQVNEIAILHGGLNKIINLSDIDIMIACIGPHGIEGISWH
jgi:hypothetical protein